MEELIGRLRDNKIYISLNGEDLKVNFNGNKLPQLILKELKENKYEIIDYLKKNLSGLKFQKIQSQPEAKCYDLSSAQRRLWILSQFEGGNLAYNLPDIYEFEGDLDIVSFQKSFDTLIERHEVLRTVFKKDESGEIKQWIKTSEEQGFEIDYQDLRKIKNKNSKVKTLVQETIEKVFDLEQGPLLRAQLLQVEKDKYVFTNIMHHIISDGWSMGVLIKELSILYNNYIQGRENPLEALNIQYKDYSAWQLRQLEEENGQYHKAYWLNQFSGKLPILELPIDHIRPALKTYNGDSISGVFSEVISKSLKEFVKKKNSTLSMGLLTLVKILLYRYTGQGDIIIGSPIAGREHADLVNQIGFYVNILALRTQFDGEDSFKELLQKVKQTTLSAYEHQIYPFDELVEQLDLRKDLSRSPLFDVMVVIQNNEGVSKDEKLGQLKTSPYEDSELLISRFELEFDFEEIDEGLEYTISYNTDLFERSTIERLEIHLQQLVVSILASPEKSINELSYLSKEETQQLLVYFNDTNAIYPKDKTIIDLFEEQVRLTPNKVGLVFKEYQFTYKELDQQVNQLANYLKNEFDIKSKTKIGVLLERSEWSIISMLSIMKLGCAYVPIDSYYPSDRINFIIKDSQVAYIITDQTESLETSANLIDIKKDLQDIKSSSLLSPTTSIDKESVSYVIYTSGSTGKPKGVEQTYVTLYNLLNWCLTASNLNHESNFALFSSFSFDMSLHDAFFTFCSGGELHVLSRETKQDLYLLKEYLIKKKIETLSLPYSALKLFFNKFTTEELESHSIKEIISAGEQLHINGGLRSFLSKNKKVTLYNFYGPSETHVVTGSSYQWNDKLPEKALIGKAISNTEIYILDVEEKLLPIGVIGEIYIGGWNLASGYLNHPELTAEKFISNPFQEGERIYKTGDLGRWLPDGNIEFMGRKDDQVKIRGYRIELGEIESVLQKKAEIDNVVVLVKEDENAEKQLVAYLTSVEELTTSDLRTYLKKTLPDYMLPSYFVLLEKLPLTPNGKIDKKALPSPEGLGLASGIEYVSPSTEIEKELVKIWSDVLKIATEKIGVKDDFFDLGGHSLRATTLASKIYQRLEVNVALKVLFENTTIEEQALFISKEDKTTYYQIEKVGEQENYALSSAQRRLWVLSQFEGGNLAYNIPGVYEFEGDLDIVSFQKSFDTLIERHEILRTVFKKDESGEIRQWIKTSEEKIFEIDYQDLRKVKNQKSEVKTLVQEAIEKVFDLEQGPLLRAQFLQIGKDKYIFTYVMHHIISDGWSMGVMIKELLTLYNNYNQGKDNPLEALKIQYKDYSAWQLNQLEDENSQGHKTYWLNQFSGELPILELPTDHIRPALKTYNGDVISGVFSEPISKSLKEVIKENNSTAFMFLLSLVKTLLYRYTGQGDIIIGSPIAGRSHADLSDQIGFYVNTLALRTQFGGEDSFKDLLQKVKQITLSAYEHQVYPFDELVDDLNLDRDLSRSPLFDVMVILQNNEEISEDEKLGELQISSYKESEWLTSKFDLLFNFMEIDAELHYSINYNSDLFERATIERLERHLQKLSLSIIATPEKSINQLSYLSKKEEQQLLVDFNDTNTDYPKDKTIIDLFEKQVKLSPNKVGLVFKEYQFTYKELDQQVNQLANYLKNEFDIKSKTKIGVLLERSEWSIISMLSIMKLGCAYVPIDPYYPSDRIDFIIKDSQAAYIITDQTDSLETSANLIDIKNGLREINSYSLLSPAISINEESICYVIYTSGSTGTPKGVEQTYLTMYNLLNWCLTDSNLNHGSNFALFSSFSFDMSLHDAFFTFCSGGELHVLSKEAKQDLDLLKEYLIEKKIETLSLPYSALKLFFNKFPTKELESHSIREIISAGEQLHISGGLRSFLSKNKKVTLYNFYGPSETHVVTGSSYQWHDKLPEKALIGKAISNTEIYILDIEEKLLPIGVIGELYIGGWNLARGYLNRPELTSEKFIPNPFEEGGRLYKTGDLCRWLPDGNIEFMGRKDGQVKINGYRIELGEIESVLQNNNLIESAVVLSKEDKQGDNILVAYVVSKEELNSLNLRSELSKELPVYMIPSYFVQLQELPLTLNGKLDKKLLPSPEVASINTGVEYIAPRNELEARLVKILSEVLGIEKNKIGVKDNFFDLGANSMKIIRILDEINRAFQLNLKTVLLYQYSNVRKFSEYILNQENASKKEENLSEALDDMIELLEE